MKRRYERPSAYIEEFTPNEYVAACGESGKVYKFRCDAGAGDRYGGNVWLETNGEAGLQKDGRWEGWGKNRKDYPGDQYLSGYKACGITHEAKSTDSFLDGYYVKYGSERVQDVIVWRGPKEDNTHCTTNLNQETWGTAKS